MAEGENEKTAVVVAGDTEPTLAPAQTPAVIAMQHALTGLLRRRLKKFVALTPQVRANAGAKIIHDALKAPLESLAALQDAVGVWHVRQMLHRAVAEALGRAEVLLNEMQAVRILLAELEKDRSRLTGDVENIFNLATEQAGQKELESWSAKPIGPHAVLVA